MVGRTNCSNLSGLGFHYTGTCRYEEDESGNWIVYFLDSGTLVFSGFGGSNQVDVFLVGGGGSGCKGTASCGGGGGNGGETAFHSGVPLKRNTSYSVVVGYGGVYGSSDGKDSGGDSSCFGLIAHGGSATKTREVPASTDEITRYGAKGGNGGIDNKGKNGSDGSMRLFNASDESLPLYGGGGGGGGGNAQSGGNGGSSFGANGGKAGKGSSATANTGGGGGGGGRVSSGTSSGGSGGTGMVAIRSHREDTTE